MNALPFLLSLLALAGGTYALRILGVTVGSRLTQRDEGRHQAAPAEADLDDAPSVPEAVAATPARLWMDRATVVLICAVAATTMVFEGQDLAGPSRLVGSLSGMVAALCKVPLLACVVLGMAVCALLRLAGVA